MGCFKICFGTCNNQKVPTKDKRLVRFEPLKSSKPVVHVSKSVVFEFKNENDVMVGRDNKEKESEIYNLGNPKCTILGNAKKENVVGVDKFLDYSLSKLEDKSLESRKISKIGDLLEESSDKKVNGLCNVGKLPQEESSGSLDSLSVGHLKGVENVDQLVQEESSDSLFSVSVGSKKKVNAADSDDVVREESSDSLFSVSVESRKQCNGLGNVDRLVQEESPDSLFSVSVGSKKKVNVAENGDDQEESSNSRFRVPVESRNQLNDQDNVDQLVQEESSDSLFSVSVGSQKKANAAENVDRLVQEESSDSLFSVSFESRKQVNAVKTDENEVNSPITFGLKHISKIPNPSPALADSVLGPIENFTTLKKEIKVTTDNTCIELKEDEKENLCSVQGLNFIPPFSIEEPSLKKLNNTVSKQKKGSHSKAGSSPIAVDSSLSSWLVKPDGGSSEDELVGETLWWKFRGCNISAAFSKD
ncbi:uncharacterized protein LOC141723336 isoform X2 [Apium graveolens]|uniref:uncharacterized protein LOC141723336 isoform X2 n=1 Tax=Apium graveolens TaxID=4045 RepID=UPI003D796158